MNKLDEPFGRPETNVFHTPRAVGAIDRYAAGCCLINRVVINTVCEGWPATNEKAVRHLRRWRLHGDYRPVSNRYSRKQTAILFSNFGSTTNNSSRLRP